MKITQRSFIISMVPLLAQTAVMAEPKPQPDPLVARTAETQGIAASWRASEIIGTNVKNAGDETIGEVQDLVVDLVSGEVLAVVIASGGFLGVADTLSAVPVSTVRYDVAAKAFKTQLTKDQLGKAPQFKKMEWPDYSVESSRSKLREFRDWIGGDVTPVDQGDSDSDLKITRDIRAAISDTELSADAKNIKVTTKAGHVTLKGEVKDHSEHLSVIKIAKEHVDAAKVTDNLKMKND